MKREVIVPEVLDPEEKIQADLKAMRNFALLLDEALPIPGTSRRIGLDAVLGFVPWLGDVVGALLSTWIVFAALRHRVPMTRILRMLVNIGLDLLVGAIPVVGDLFDVVFTENVANVNLLLQHRDRARPPRHWARIVFGIGGVLMFVILLSAALLAWAVWVIASWRLQG